MISGWKSRDSSKPLDMEDDLWSLGLHEDYGKVTLDTIRRLYRRNSRVTLYKLVQKIHPTDMAWVFRYLNSAGSLLQV